jgi:hypothetical protein
MESSATEPAFRSDPAPNSKASIATGSSSPAQSNRCCAGDETLQNRCTVPPRLPPPKTKTYGRVDLICFAGWLDPRLAQEWDQQAGPFRPGSNEHAHLTVSVPSAPAEFSGLLRSRLAMSRGARARFDSGSSRGGCRPWPIALRSLGPRRFDSRCPTVRSILTFGDRCDCCRRMNLP